MSPALPSNSFAPQKMKRLVIREGTLRVFLSDRTPPSSQSLVGSPASTLIRDLYGGTMLNIIQCLECATASSRPETFHDISVPVKGHGTLLSG
jgi:hypothetical protein